MTGSFFVDIENAISGWWSFVTMIVLRHVPTHNGILPARYIILWDKTLLLDAVIV